MGNSVRFAVAIVALCAMAVLGAGSPIDVNNPDIQWLGRWAVTEHVKMAQDGIKFNRVVRAESDEESELATLLHLFIDATNRDGKDAKYEAVLNHVDRPHAPGLLDFKPAN